MKKTLSLFLLLLVAVTSMAQTTMGEINRIKRDSEYLYGEATMNDKQAALQLAYELLETEIKNWAAAKNSKITSVTASQIFEIADTIILSRHNMIRAFVYVNTRNLKAQKGKTLTVEVRKDEPVTKPVVVEKPKEELVKVNPVTPATAIPAAKPVAAKPQPAPQPKNDALEKILKVTTFYDLEKTLEPLRVEGKVKSYGKYSTMQNPAECYLIIYDTDANIRAVLGKGTDSRKNLRTGKNDTEKAYKGCGALWFMLDE